MTMKAFAQILVGISSVCFFWSANRAVTANNVPTSSDSQPETIRGWISDEWCGRAHMKPGGADCIRKCMKGGADIGHPEWKPGRMVFVKDKGKKIFYVTNPEFLKGKEGEHVEIRATPGAHEKKSKYRSLTVCAVAPLSP